jgi:hypothetical protein
LVRNDFELYWDDLTRLRWIWFGRCL